MVHMSHEHKDMTKSDKECVVPLDNGLVTLIVNEAKQHNAHDIVEKGEKMILSTQLLWPKQN